MYLSAAQRGGDDVVASVIRKVKSVTDGGKKKARARANVIKIGLDLMTWFWDRDCDSRGRR